ncbi:MAG: 16S rRNA (guanine(527)-N(7))-methyltransferase RsmG [Sphingomicrobium sp.]
MKDELERLTGRHVSLEAIERLIHFVAMIRSENVRQNLVSRGTLPDIWNRHILDSAQLLRFETSSSASWLDIGAGAGFPGIVLACLTAAPVTLIEPRRLRALFLREVIDALGLHAGVEIEKAERAVGKFGVISARAVASISKLLGMSYHLSTSNTRWVLPKGQSGLQELQEARKSWHGVFQLEQSLIDPRSLIVIAQNVRPRES